MARRKRRKFTREFKAEAVRLTQVPGASVGKVAKDLDLTETALREWMDQARGSGRGEGSPRRFDNR